MTNPTIKFSHEYYKMPRILDKSKTYLIGASVIHYKGLPEGFIEYDTGYSNGIEQLNYPLPKTNLIILTLFTDSEQTAIVWTTVRRYTPAKYDYYQDLIGKEVTIKIEEDKA